MKTYILEHGYGPLHTSHPMWANTKKAFTSKKGAIAFIQNCFDINKGFEMIKQNRYCDDKNETYFNYYCYSTCNQLMQIHIRLTCLDVLQY